LAKYYDRIFWWKDYNEEVNFLIQVFRKNSAQAKQVLEVACGTGNHTKILAARGYQVTGVDVSEDVLRIARRKVGRRARFIRGDMRNLDAVVDGKYDAAICLFSAISYNLTTLELRRTMQGLYGHLKNKGVLVFDTHFTKRHFLDGYREESVFDDGKVIGARINVSKREGDVGELSFTYLIKDGQKTLTLRNDIHKLGLFDSEDFLRIMREVGFIKTQMYVDWTFKKQRSESQFADLIFVGCKP